MNGDFGGAGGTGVRIATASVRTGFAMTHYKKCGRAGRRGRRPLRKRILWCVGEGLCPSRGRPQGSPLRMGYRGCGRRAVGDAGPYGGYKGCDGRATARVAPTKRLQGVRYKIGGRGRTPPLRRVTRSDCVRGWAASLHQGSFLQRSSVLWTTWATLWPRPG